MAKTIICCIIIGIFIICVLCLVYINLSRKKILESVKIDVNTNKLNADLYYYLPKANIKIITEAKFKIVSGNLPQIIEQSFSLEKQIIPDENYLFLLKHVSNWLVNDELKLTINKTGLLSTLEIIAEDKFPSIINTFSQSSSSIFSNKTAIRSTNEADVSIKEFKRELIIDLSEFKTREGKYLKKEFTALTETGAECKFGFFITKTEKEAESLPFNGSYSFQGIIVRPVKPIKFTIVPTSEILKEKNSPSVFFDFFPDQSRILEVPIKRAMFVKKMNNLTIENGMLTVNEIKKPSEFEGVISVPIKIAKAIVSIPAQLISLKIDRTNKQKQLNQAMQDLQSTIIKGEKNDLIQQFENQKLLLEAEKNMLETQNQLKEIKKDIEELKKENNNP